MTSGWPDPAPLAGQVRLCFPAADDALHDLSAATRIDDTLFLASDEGCALDRLTPEGDDRAAHRRFALADLLPLRWPEEEGDIEGLAVAGDWLWIVGSHARARRKLEKEPDSRIDLRRLADLRDTRARCLLARVPLVRTGEGWEPVARDGDRRAGLVKQGAHGGVLARALRHDPLLRAFRRVPAKEGGIDVEGIAVIGDRVALGMRGPVIDGHALLLELNIVADADGRLRPQGIPVKRLLDLKGLGIRDLKRHGDDLLILAGPTTALSGPVALYRWPAWVNDPPHDPDIVRLHEPEHVLDLPFGRYEDHPEALALWDDDCLLVVCDTPARHRIDAGAITADLFRLPAA